MPCPAALRAPHPGWRITPLSAHSRPPAASAGSGSPFVGRAPFRAYRLRLALLVLPWLAALGGSFQQLTPVVPLSYKRGGLVGSERSERSRTIHARPSLSLVREREDRRDRVVGTSPAGFTVWQCSVLRAGNSMDILPKPSLRFTADSALPPPCRQRWQRENRFVRGVLPFLLQVADPDSLSREERAQRANEDRRDRVVGTSPAGFPVWQCSVLRAGNSMDILPKPSLRFTAVSALPPPRRQRWQRENRFVRDVLPFLW